MWTDTGPNRWNWQADNDRHFLLRSGDTFVELHTATIHFYAVTGPEPLKPVEGGWLLNSDALAPDASLTWAKTVTDEELPELGDKQVWERMAELAAGPAKGKRPAARER